MLIPLKPREKQIGFQFKKRRIRGLPKASRRGTRRKYRRFTEKEISLALKMLENQEIDEWRTADGIVIWHRSEYAPARLGHIVRKLRAMDEEKLRRERQKREKAASVAREFDRMCATKPEPIRRPLGKCPDDP